ncbi:hypothetical protein FPV67DRAFT_973099 [Lyophyllum atratum]|nr:hypothetical protein FPV67DRAFT_973099 [Lyophyllum atratum]
MSVAQDTPQRNGGPQVEPLRRISERFNAHDADIIFASSDHVLFYIYRKHLESNAAAFPPAEFETRGEIVPLTEDAATLELLFQYTYPQRHPHLGDVTFDTLARLAEAAEKYEVFAAMNICSLRMKQLLPRHAAEIFSYANKHGYTDIMSEAGPLVLDTPLDEVVKGLSLQYVVPWVCYREAWSRAAFGAINSLPYPYFRDTNGSIPCRHCSFSIDRRAQFDGLWQKLGEKRSIDAMERLYIGMANLCPHVTTEVLRARLREAVSQVPTFATFLYNM